MDSQESTSQSQSQLDEDKLTISCVPLQKHLGKTMPRCSTPINPMLNESESSQRFREDFACYLDLVQHKYWDRPEVYYKFLNIMHACKLQGAPLLNVIILVTELFKEHPRLIVGFREFFLPNSVIQAYLDKYRHIYPMQSSALDVNSVPHTAALSPLQHNNMANARLLQLTLPSAAGSTKQPAETVADLDVKYEKDSNRHTLVESNPISSLTDRVSSPVLVTSCKSHLNNAENQTVSQSLEKMEGIITRSMKRRILGEKN